VPPLPRELRDVRYASQQLTKQGPRRHNRSIGSPEAVGLDETTRNMRYKRLIYHDKVGRPATNLI
jgi:hypothetical protein